MDTTFYTIFETADIFKVHPQTVVALIKREQLSAVKVGRQWRITDQDIAEFQKRRTVKSKKQPI